MKLVLNLFVYVCVALAIAFTGLKLSGVVSWSWWLVLLPLYTPLALAVLSFLLAFAYFALVERKRPIDLD